MMGLLVENLLILVCIIIGINSCWGFVVASQLREIADFCLGQDDGCNPPQVKNLSHGIVILSIMLLVVMIVGSVFGASLILELLLVYNIFHMVGLAMVTISICKFWRLEDVRPD